MRVAIDVSPLKTGHKFRGIGFYTERLTASLQKLIAVGSKYRDWQIELIENWKLKIGNFDLVHYPYFDLFFLTLPIKKHALAAVTIHDVIPLVFPEHYPKGLKGWFKFQVQKFSLKGAAAVITDSQNSKKDIVKYLGFSKDKIFVVPLAPGEDFKPLAISHQLLVKTRRKYFLPERFILYVGDVNWNKNIPGLVRACEKIEIPLVIVGKQAKRQDFDQTHPENKDLVWLQNKHRSSIINHRSSIILTGFVPTKDLAAIYNLAAVYCQPSFYEGFGLPVLEAMACGAPVVCSKTSSLPEVAGGAAIFVDPKDIKSISQGIKHVIENEEVKETFRKKSISRASQFSWKKTAEKTIGVYKKILRKQ